jgi:hypothetical protein
MKLHPCRKEHRVIELKRRAVEKELYLLEIANKNETKIFKN